MIATHLCLIKYVIISYDVLFLILGVVSLRFCKGALSLEHGNFERTWASIVLMQHFQVVATRVKKKIRFSL